MYLDDCVCVLPDLTWLPLLGVGRKSWYIIITNPVDIFIAVNSLVVLMMSSESDSEEFYDAVDVTPKLIK